MVAKPPAPKWVRVVDFLVGAAVAGHALGLFPRMTHATTTTQPSLLGPMFVLLGYAALLFACPSRPPTSNASIRSPMRRMGFVALTAGTIEAGLGDEARCPPPPDDPAEVGVPANSFCAGADVTASAELSVGGRAG